MSEPLSTLEIRFETHEFDQGPGDGPRAVLVKILIDGEERLATADQRIGDHVAPISFVGFYAIDDLDALLPLGTPNRIAVYQCSCGISGCGVAAPLISEASGVVTWEDFRTFTAVFDGRTPDFSDADDWQEDGWELSFHPVHFDADQYRAEIARATTELDSSKSQSDT